MMSRINLNRVEQYLWKLTYIVGQLKKRLFAKLQKMFILNILIV